MVPDATDSRIDPRYGWVIVFITFVLTGLCFGGTAVVAIILKPLEAEFGWQRGEISLAYTVATVSAALSGVVFGRITDRFGARAPAVLGAIIIGFSLAMVSRITALWQLYLWFVLFGAIGFGALNIPLTTVLTNWFTARRGLALGIATAGGAIGQGVVPFIARSLITDHGWRASFLYLGAAYLLIALPLALLVRSPPVGAEDSGGDASRALEQQLTLRPREALFWVCSAVIFCCACMSVPIIHAAALASDAGVEAQQAAAVITVMMLSGAVGRVVTGQIADRIGALNAYILASLCQTAAAYWFVVMHEPLGFFVLAAIFGFGFGSVMTSFLLTIRALVPTRIAGASIGLVILFGWISMGMGAYLGGALFDWTGNYRTSFAFAAISGMINLAVLLSLSMRLRAVRAAGAAA